jgi:hypothetical protein
LSITDPAGDWGRIRATLAGVFALGIAEIRADGSPDDDAVREEMIGIIADIVRGTRLRTRLERAALAAGPGLRLSIGDV